MSPWTNQAEHKFLFAQSGNKVACGKLSVPLVFIAPINISGIDFEASGRTEDYTGAGGGSCTGPACQGPDDSAPH
jgi:hypothetical protein